MTRQALVRDLLRFAAWLVVLLPFDLAVRRVRRPVRGDGGRTKVLILRPDALGDLVLWLDAAEALRALYPPDRCEITLLVNQNWQPLAESLPWFDRVWGMDRRKFATQPLYRYKFLKQVRQASFDLALNTVFVRDFLWSDPVVWASGAPVRAGYHGDFSIITPLLMRFADRWYTRVVFSRAEPLSEMERNADFVRALGAEDYRAGVSRLPDLRQEPRSLQEPYFLLVPGAGKDYRQWPPDGFAEIARRLFQEQGWTGIVVGAASDADLGKRLAEQGAADGVPVEDRTGRTTLAEMVQLIAGAQLVISNETSAVHIAAATGTPAVSVTGGGHFGRYVPYRLEKPTLQPLPVAALHEMPCFGCNWQCIYPVPPGAPKPCVAGITVETVWEAVRQAIQEQSKIQEQA